MEEYNSQWWLGMVFFHLIPLYGEDAGQTPQPLINCYNWDYCIFFIYSMKHSDESNIRKYRSKF